MDKITLAIGTAYNLEIGSNDTSIGKYEAELSIVMRGYSINIKLKHHGSIDYSITVPKTLSNLLNKKLKYKLYANVSNSRFLIDSGELSIIGEESFNVKSQKSKDDERPKPTDNADKRNKEVQIKKEQKKDKTDKLMSKEIKETLEKSRILNEVNQTKQKLSQLNTTISPFLTELNDFKEDNKKRTKMKAEKLEQQHNNDLKNKKIQDVIKQGLQQ